MLSRIKYFEETSNNVYATEIYATEKNRSLKYYLDEPP